MVNVRELLEKHRFEQYDLRCGCTCGWGTTLGGSYGDWAEHFAALLATSTPTSRLSQEPDWDALVWQELKAKLHQLFCAGAVEGQPRNLIATRIDAADYGNIPLPAAQPAAAPAEHKLRTSDLIGWFGRCSCGYDCEIERDWTEHQNAVRTQA